MQVHDSKAMLQTIISGMKTLVFSINHYTRALHQIAVQAAAAANLPSLPTPVHLGMAEDEVRMMAR